MAAPTFVPGFAGTITFGGFVLYVAGWDFNFEVEKLSYDTFSKTTSLGYYLKNYVPGLATGMVRVRGYWDDTASQMLSGPTVLIRPGGSAPITITYDGSTGYSMTGFVEKINPKTAAGATADFDFDYQMLTFSAWLGQS